MRSENQERQKRRIERPITEEFRKVVGTKIKERIGSEEARKTRIEENKDQEYSNRRAEVFHTRWKEALTIKSDRVRKGRVAEIMNQENNEREQDMTKINENINRLKERDVGLVIPVAAREIKKLRQGEILRSDDELVDIVLDKILNSKKRETPLPDLRTSRKNNSCKY